MWWLTHKISVLGRWRRAHPWLSLAPQSSLVDEPQASERLCEKSRWVASGEMTPEADPWPLRTCVQLHTRELVCISTMHRLFAVIPERVK